MDVKIKDREKEIEYLRMALNTVGEINGISISMNKQRKINEMH